LNSGFNNLTQAAWNAAIASIDTPEMVEKVAKAIFTDRNGKWDYNKFRSQMQPYIDDAKAAIAAIKEQANGGGMENLTDGV